MKMTKKFTALCTIMLSALLILSLTSCGGSEISLSDGGAEVISLMHEMVNSEGWADLYGIHSEYDEEIALLRQGDYRNASAVYELSIPNSELPLNDVDESTLSDSLLEYVRSSVYTSIASTINTRGGMDATVISSLFCAQTTFVNKDIEEPQVYLYVFENGRSIMVSFIPGEGGSVRAIGNFILNENFAADDADTITASFEAVGYKGVRAVKK